MPRLQRKILGCYITVELGHKKGSAIFTNKCLHTVSVDGFVEDISRGKVVRLTVALRSDIQAIDVPVSLLLSRDLTPAAKFLWIRLHFDETHPRPRSHDPRKLAARTCLARSTIYAALKMATASGWLVPTRDPSNGERRWKTARSAQYEGRAVQIPVDLIRASHVMRPQAILCYGLLQVTPKFNGIAGEFKWAELRKMTGLHLRTVKRCIRELAEARWIYLQQRNRRAPIWFRLQHADEAYVEEIRKRIEGRKNIGELLMREELSLIVATNKCQDGARPDFLVNPATGEKMELDRYYPLDHVAFEYNGSQHYVATEQFSKEQVTAQRKRDALKRQICKKEEIALVVVRSEDLTLTRMLKKVGNLLPRRSLRGFKQTIRYLNRCVLGYQRASPSYSIG